MRVLTVIPARLGSTRLPHKPLRLFAGEPLVCAVARRVRQWGIASRIVVATDHARVVEAVAAVGVEAHLSGAPHRSGTDRVAEVAGHPEHAGAGYVLSVQVDEPLVPLEAAAGALGRVRAGDPVGTAACPLGAEDLTSRDRVKVVVDESGRALRFTRDYPASGAWACGVEVLRHVGIYAYRRSALLRWAELPPTPEEEAERLEQLRPLAHGWTIGVARLTEPAPPGIDTERDLAVAATYLESMSHGAGR